jgi:soluble lytic murein transglycosylase-like protein
MPRPKRQTRRAFLKGLLLAGGGATLTTAVVRSNKRDKKMMGELAELEKKRKEREFEHNKKSAELKEQSKRGYAKWRAKVKKERSEESILKRKAEASAFKVPKGMAPESVEEFIAKNFDVLRANTQKGITQKQVEVNKKYYGEMLGQACKEIGFDPVVAKKVLDGESSWNPKSISTKGAVGLFQMMPSNYVSDKKYRHNPLIPEENIFAGVRMLKDNLNLFKGDMRKTIAAYNYGTNAVIRISAKHGENWEQNSFGMHRYVKKILGK